MITIYSKQNCPQCVQAINLARSRGLEFEVKKLGVDYEKEYLLERGVRAVPYIVEDDLVVGGLKDFQEYRTNVH